MTMKKLVHPTVRLAAVQSACVRLIEARDQLRRAGADKAAAYVQRALKSAQGAERHAMGREGNYLRAQQREA